MASLAPFDCLNKLQGQGFGFLEALIVSGLLNLANNKNRLID